MLVRVDGPNNRHAVIRVVCLLDAIKSPAGSYVSARHNLLKRLLSSLIVALCSLLLWTMWPEMETTPTTTSLSSLRKDKDAACEPLLPSLF